MVRCQNQKVVLVHCLALTFSRLSLSSFLLLFLLVMTSSAGGLRLASSSRSVDPPLLSPGGRSTSKRKANDLLRNYYGLGDTASSSPSSNRLDADSDNFDAQLAFQALLQSKSLSQLLKQESDLLTEIRELDGERQSLVYNHHHELVSATETIGKVSRSLLLMK
jgi:hypothetical protein